MQYESTDEATTRLNGAVFTYKGQVIYCDGVSVDGGKINLHVTFYPRASEQAIVSLNDPDLNYSKFLLGYVNMARGASYISRLPTRGHYKQGLFPDNLSLTRVSDGYRPEFQDVIRSPGFTEMLLGRYPTFNEAARRLSTEMEGGHPKTVAFNRIFAVGLDEFRRDHLLFYKGTRVGFGDLSGFKLNRDFTHLKEVSELAHIKVL